MSKSGCLRTPGAKDMVPLAAPTRSPPILPPPVPGALGKDFTGSPRASCDLHSRCGSRGHQPGDSQGQTKAHCACPLQYRALALSPIKGGRGSNRPGGWVTPPPPPQSLGSTTSRMLRPGAARAPAHPSVQSVWPIQPAQDAP